MIDVDGAADQRKLGCDIGIHRSIAVDWTAGLWSAICSEPTRTRAVNPRTYLVELAAKEGGKSGICVTDPRTASRPLSRGGIRAVNPLIPDPRGGKGSKVFPGIAASSLAHYPVYAGQLAKGSASSREWST
ncbi:hypothetical protein HS1genome_1749 [Sulfodiicoccus acidiphilus]|uniref:Uncharacterized protein n=1 Tax=Sulfodiicoccus acidiphilus TaxID=1670455 RepID=A0A348B5A8_9CREN|nr:hypothetical protein [Sulfodiicoccus acidiphilus]BBD73360.1 hypothetical protein HS1genome_1749 [Sulfodiicoccus acidiphilus]GGU00925.1 hypothetical protein GCM10007116_17680 [Sulfodiicoccus acidiphilus]